MNYQFWVIRYVPNVARGEFTNVGIVCGIDGGDWEVRFDVQGIPAAGALRNDLRELRSWTTWFRRRVATHGQRSFDNAVVTTGWIEHLRHRQANSIQFAEPAPIRAESAAAAIELLFPHLVERTHTSRRRGLTRSGMRHDVRGVLQHELGLVLGRTLHVQPRARVGQQRGAFDLARDESSRTVLTNVWTFNAATLTDLERDNQSWNYLVSRFRADGGSVELSGTQRLLAGSEPIEVVYDPPTVARDASWRHDVFDAAREGWQLNGVVAVELDEYLRRAAGRTTADLD